MPWEIRRDLHLDIHAHYGAVLLTSGTDSSLKNPPPDLVAGDRMPVRIHFWERGANGTLTAADPGETSTIIFTARPNNVPPGTDLLFQANDFAEITPGVWEGSLDLSTAEFAAHLATAPTGPKTITGEVELRDSTGLVKRLSLQFPLTARPQAYENQDSPTLLPGPLDWLAANSEAALAALGGQVPGPGGSAVVQTIPPNTYFESTQAAAYPLGISYMQIDQTGAGIDWILVLQGQKGVLVNERFDDAEDGFTGRQSVYLMNTAVGEVLLGQRRGGESYWTPWELPETQAGAAAKVAAHFLALNAPPISHSTRPLIVSGDLFDSALNGLSSPVTLQKTGAFWEYELGNIYWQAGFTGTQPWLSYYDSGLGTGYYAEGLVGNDFPDAGFTPDNSGIDGTGTASVVYAPATLAPTGATALENGNVWRNTGTATEPEWQLMVTASDLAAGLSTRVDLTTAQTISGAKTYTAPIVSTGTPTAGIHLLNRDQLRREAMLSHPVIFPTSAALYAATGTGSSASEINSTAVLSAGGPSSAQGDNASVSFDYFLNARGVGANNRHAHPWDVFLFTNGILDLSDKALIISTGTINPSTGLLTGLGVAVRVLGDNATLQIHNGTTLYQSTVAFAGAYQFRTKFIIAWDGDRTLSLFGSTSNNQGVIARPGFIGTLTAPVVLGVTNGSRRDLLVCLANLAAAGSSRSISIHPPALSEY